MGFVRVGLEAEPLEIVEVGLGDCFELEHEVLFG
jgi:hypothetical protein